MSGLIRAVFETPSSFAERDARKWVAVKMRLTKQRVPDLPASGQSLHHHALEPLRASFPDLGFALLHIDHGRPSHVDPTRIGSPDLSEWADHDWSAAQPTEGVHSLFGWSFYPFGNPAHGAIAVDTRRTMLEDHRDRAIHAHARLLGAIPLQMLKESASVSNRVSVSSAQELRSQIHLGFFMWCAASSRLTGDPRMATLCGLTDEALKYGITWSDLLTRIHQEDRPPPDQSPIDWLITAPEQGVRLFSATGEMIRVHISAQPHGKDCTGTIIDITHEDRLALRTSQAFINSMLVSANDCVKILDLSGVVTFINHGAIRVLNLCTASEMIGLYWPDVWQERGRNLALDAIEAAGAGRTSHFQDYIETSDGRTRLWDVIIAPILGADGKPERILGVSREMSVANQEHERLELALEAGTIIGMWLWDAERRLITGDKRMAATLDLPSAQLTAGVTLERILEGVTPEDRPAIAAALDEALRDKKRFRCEFRLRDDGTRTSRWVEANGSCTYDEEGNVSHFPGILLDIDAPKRQTLKREALVVFGDELRTLSSTSDVLDLTSRTLGVTIEADRSGFADVDHERELAQVTDCWRRDPSITNISGLYAFRSFGSYIERLKKGEVVAIDDVRTHPLTVDQADSFIPLQICALLNVPIMENDVLQAVVIVQFRHPHCWDEITLSFVRTVADRSWAAIRQMRAQDALRRLNETLEDQVVRRTKERDRLWAISSDLLALMDREGRLRYLNPSWQNSFGDKARHWLDSKLEHLVHPEDMTRAVDALALLREGRLEHGVDLRFQRHDGAWHTFNWSGSIEGDDIYLTGRDVTDRIALEDQLRQSQKMEAVGQLTGGLAHDFNNILGGIGGALDLLTRRLEQGRTEGLDRYITAARGATDRAAALTHRLLAFSRRQTLDPQAADVNALILSMNDLLDGTVGPGITLDLQLNETIGPALVDMNQLENALLNLSINARDAMPEGGILRIATSRAILGSLQAEEWGLRPGPYLVLSVTDTGVGMSTDVMARAFDPFFTTKPIGQGTGLGLSMIYGFARQSGGRVSIVSTPAAGTSVHIWLPSHTATLPVAPALPEREQSGVSLRHLRVLLVDDEETLRFTMRETMEDWGAVVHEAGDSTAALALLNHQELLFDIMVTDVGLPGGLNGRQLADAARELRPGLPVLFITGYAEQAVFSGGMPGEKIHILPKPFTTPHFEEKLRATLSAA
ncbi:PAS domain-containing protein [Asaia astilbis]|uniref:PAS domain-containing protein n=1 Tax=Asaia astilbis TaxID=610244 RepID=UPI0004720015|nr:PAS domain-containing protein [Asaia astilbis]